ncbi:hypothetical protein [Gordonia sp. DT101]|uniref:phage tail tube protein n=1 Tax=Gordonia sp. DT101 TaxID=3416545 RepID=UPI003CF95AA9
MSQTTFAAQPRVGGALRNAPVGTTAPTDASTALDAAFKDLGYISEDGFTEAIERSADKKRALGGSVIRTVQTEYGATVSFVFMESLKLDVLKRVYGESNVTVEAATGEITVRKNKKPLPIESWVIDLEDGDVLDRSYIARGQITEIGETVKTHGDLAVFEVTLEALEDEDGDCIKQFIYPGDTSGN